MLNFDADWRFKSPGPLTQTAVDEFRSLIDKIATQLPGQWVFERFKERFALAAGVPYYSSSNVRFARQDLDGAVALAAENGPMFIEAFWDAAGQITSANPSVSVPPLEHLNEILARSTAGYVLARHPTGGFGPEQVRLVRVGTSGVVAVPERPQSLDARAQEIIQHSLAESDALLAQGKDRQAVQEVLWLLESVTTVFRGLEDSDTKIVGSYFNKIMAELRGVGAARGTEVIFDWIRVLHGYLSAPGGGGVRHGIDLRNGVALGPNEARLYCNLIRSYLVFLLGEYARLQGNG